MASLSLIMDDYNSLASKGVSVSLQGLARVYYTSRVLCVISEVVLFRIDDDLDVTLYVKGKSSEMPCCLLL